MNATETVRVGFADDGARIQGLAIEGAGALLALGDRVETVPGFALEDIDGVRCRLAGDGAYDVTLEPLGPPAELGSAARVWICRAEGTVGDLRLDGFASITRSVRAERVGLERAVTAWFGAELAIALAARRPRRASGHGDEELHAAILRGTPLEPAPVSAPRLSSTYDADGLLLRCGIELWETPESDFALRYGGVAGARGELAHADGALTQVAFVTWRGERDRGVGRYEITER